MWMGEQITEIGIGNGISIILFAGILSRVPTMVSQMVGGMRAGSLKWWMVLLVICLLYTSPALFKKFGYKSTMQIPKIEKVVLNVGCGEARENPKVLDAVVSQLSQITGQKAIITIAKKSVANFKLREGMPVGAKVTLRGDKMWEFLDRLFNVALPRVRDFRGISANAFDGRGNYALGIKEQLIFPEIEYDKIDKIRGMDIVICTTAQTDEEARELLTLVGAPFER